MTAVLLGFSAPLGGADQAAVLTGQVTMRSGISQAEKEAGDQALDKSSAPGESAKETDSAAIPAARSDIQEDPKKDAAGPAPRKRWIVYNRKGLHLGTGESLFQARINLRSQLRFSSPFDSAPRRIGDFERPDDSGFGFRRARFKVAGHAFKPWISYDYQHDLVDTRVLDARFAIEKYDWLQLRVGQWKVDYSRERIDSSGRQQFADRSIVNRAFTIDRQKGAMLLGNLMQGTAAASSYYVGVFSGNGRGFRSNDGVDLDHSDGSPMWVARYQWNFLGKDPGYSQSDVEYHDKPAASLAVATARNRSRFTRFSSSGGGQLDGFENSAPGQYSLRQFVEDASLKYRGLHLQHELHWKRIIDNINLATTHMRGGYVQGGYFFHHLWPSFPKQLELGTRFAVVDPHTDRDDDLQREWAVVINWFFEGHSNKLTFDTSRYALGRTSQPDLSDTQVRVQWDVSF